MDVLGPGVDVQTAKPWVVDVRMYEVYTVVIPEQSQWSPHRDHVQLLWLCRRRMSTVAKNGLKSHHQDRSA